MIVIDSNIIIHAFNVASPHRSAASRILRDAINGSIESTITPQVIAEFYSVSTNPKRMESPIAPDQASAICADILSSEIQQYTPDYSVLQEGVKLAEKNRLRGARIYDCLIAAAAHQLGADAVYTENVKDFVKIGVVPAVNPFQEGF